jgi:hypothetical protein
VPAGGVRWSCDVGGRGALASRGSTRVEGITAATLRRCVGSGARRARHGARASRERARCAPCSELARERGRPVRRSAALALSVAGVTIGMWSMRPVNVPCEYQDEQ